MRTCTVRYNAQNRESRTSVRRGLGRATLRTSLAWPPERLCVPCCSHPSLSRCTWLDGRTRTCASPPFEPLPHPSPPPPSACAAQSLTRQTRAPTRRPLAAAQTRRQSCVPLALRPRSGCTSHAAASSNYRRCKPSRPRWDQSQAGGRSSRQADACPPDAPAAWTVRPQRRARQCPPTAWTGLSEPSASSRSTLRRGRVAAQAARHGEPSGHARCRRPHVPRSAPRRTCCTNGVCSSSNFHIGIASPPPTGRCWVGACAICPPSSSRSALRRIRVAAEAARLLAAWCWPRGVPPRDNFGFT